MIDNWRPERLETELHRLRSDAGGMNRDLSKLKVQQDIDRASVGDAISLCNTRIAAAAVVTFEVIAIVFLILMTK